MERGQKVMLLGLLGAGAIVWYASSRGTTPPPLPEAPAPVFAFPYYQSPYITVTPRAVFKNQMIRVQGTGLTPRGTFNLYFDTIAMVRGNYAPYGTFAISWGAAALSSGVHTIRAVDNNTGRSSNSVQIRICDVCTAP